MGWNHERLYCYHPWFMSIQPKLDTYNPYCRDRWDMLGHDFKPLVCTSHLGLTLNLRPSDWNLTTPNGP
jgi:hypothetical protein